MADEHVAVVALTATTQLTSAREATTATRSLPRQALEFRSLRTRSCQLLNSVTHWTKLCEVVIALLQTLLTCAPWHVLVQVGQKRARIWI